MVRVALVQQRATSNKSLNVERGLRALEAAAGAGARLCCYPELSFEPFYPQWPAKADVLEKAEPIPGPISEAFCAKARELGIGVVFNLFERDSDHTYDTSPVINADGTLLGKTRMVHITDYSCFHEQGYYSPGDRGVPVYDTEVGRIGVAICYDRHYPEYMRALVLQGAELVVVPQAGTLGEWPEGLYEAEMRVAAFQNGYFVALCNRTGEEEQLTFAGESFVCAPDGSVVARAPQNEEHILYADLDFSKVIHSHARRLFLRDRRPELYSGWLSNKT